MSDQPLCLDNFMVTVPDGLATIFYLPYLGLRPKAPPHNTTGGLHTLPESLSCHSDGHLFHIWTSETIPWGQFQIRVGCVLSQFIFDCLITTVVVLFSIPGGTHTVFTFHWWCFGWFSITLWCVVPIADFGFSGFSISPLARLIIWGNIEGMILLCVLGIDKEPDEWMSYLRGANEGNV